MFRIWLNRSKQASENFVLLTLIILVLFYASEARATFDAIPANVSIGKCPGGQSGLHGPSCIYGSYPTIRQVYTGAPLTVKVYRQDEVDEIVRTLNERINLTDKAMADQKATLEEIKRILLSK